jgi:hypothetical protein
MKLDWMRIMLAKHIGKCPLASLFKFSNLVVIHGYPG